MEPDKALTAFELGAQYGDTLAAYNAAVMRFERGAEGDLGKARALAEQAAKAGDRPAAALLDLMR